MIDKTQPLKDRGLSPRSKAKRCLLRAGRRISQAQRGRIRAAQRQARQRLPLSLFASMPKASNAKTFQREHSEFTLNTNSYFDDESMGMGPKIWTEAHTNDHIHNFSTLETYTQTIQSHLKPLIALLKDLLNSCYSDSKVMLKLLKSKNKWVCCHAIA